MATEASRYWRFCAAVTQPFENGSPAPKRVSRFRSEALLLAAAVLLREMVNNFLAMRHLTCTNRVPDVRTRQVFEPSNEG